jgi:hypothetical protein
VLTQKLDKEDDESRRITLMTRIRRAGLGGTLREAEIAELHLLGLNLTEVDCRGRRAELSAS